MHDGNKMKQKTHTPLTALASVHKDSNGIETLLGDPKGAIIKLSIPMIIALSAQTIYNLVDAIWVSGLGIDALAAVGFVFPIFFIAMGLSNGLGIGGGSAISRRIGAMDKKGADNVATHTIIIMLLLTILFTIPLLIFTDELFLLIGAGKTGGMAASYARILFGGSIFIFFTNVANSILRAEGDARRAMYALALGACLNIVLDPVFIYTFDLGVEGAAWATFVSLAVSSALMLNWMLFKKDTYVDINIRGFKFDKKIVKDIIGVGLPSSVMHLSMSLTMVILNVLIVIVGTTDGVAVYSVGWRVATIATLPLVGISTAVVSVTGAAYGARTFEKVSIAHLYATKIGVSIEIVIAVVTFILAPYIAAVFTHSQGTADIANDLTIFLRIICLFYIAVPFGMLSSALFQGTGKGINALTVTVLRTIILTSLFAVVFAFYFDFGLEGIWLGLVMANIIGSVVAFSWARWYIYKLRIKSSLRSDFLD